MSESKAERELRLYREAMGRERAARQAQLARDIRPCCGTPKAEGHAPYCTRRGRDGQS